MDFALTEEQTAIFDMAHAFGQEHIAPFARQWESEGTPYLKPFGRRSANWALADYTFQPKTAARG